MRSGCQRNQQRRGGELLASAYVTQLKGDRYYAVWPQSLAEAQLVPGFRGR